MTAAPLPDSVRVELIAHACLRLVTPDSVVLCDPWFGGPVFNGGWRLDPQPDLDRADLSSVTHLWISHEHPDHFHLPSLRTLAGIVDPARVRVLFQQTNSSKVFDALAAIGFTNSMAMRHLTPVRLDDRTELFVYAHRQLDSALGVVHDGRNVLLDINDVELNATDCAIIRKRFGTFPVLCNQFSIAGFDGVLDPARLEQQRLRVLTKLADHHRWLGAATTVPFASFMYFCMPDNAALNEHLNSALDAKRHMQAEGLGCTLLAPTAGAVPVAALARGEGDASDFYARHYRTRSLAVDDLASTTLDACASAFATRTSIWRRRTATPIYRRLHDISAHVEDLDVCVVLDFQHCRLRVGAALTADHCPLRINSQPLEQAFAAPFGIQTLGVSGRYRFACAVPSWKLVRIISSLANADLYLGPRSLASRATVRWIWERRRGLARQVWQQVARFRE